MKLPSNKSLVSALIPSLVFWWIVLIFLFDFQKILLVRKTQLYLNPKFAGFHLMFNEMIARLTVYSQVRFSRPLDIFFLTTELKPSQLPVYHLTIDPHDLAQLNLKILEVIQSGGIFLTDKHSVKAPAQITFQNQTHSANISYRGDRYSHWTGNKKSFNLDIIDPPSHLNLIIPEERGFVDAALAKHVARKLNLMVQADDYATVSLNGQDLGVYYQTEDLNGQFLNDYHKPMGNLYADLYGNIPDSAQIRLFDNVADWKKKVTHPQQADSQRQDLTNLLNWVHQQEQGRLSPSTLIDLDNFIRWQAHFLLMGNVSQDNQHNLKLYSNPQTGKFEFIVDDIAFYPAANSLFLPCSIFNLNGDNPSYNRLVMAVNQDPEILSARNRLLKEYVSNPANLADDLKFVNDLIARLTPELHRGIRKSTHLQLAYSLWSTPRSLESWYQRLNYELETCY